MYSDSGSEYDILVMTSEAHVEAEAHGVALGEDFVDISEDDDDGTVQIEWIEDLENCHEILCLE